MLKTILTIISLFITELVAQPAFNHLHRMDQKDSLYYLLTDNALLKFYSHEASGEFFLTKYVEGNFPSSTKFALNDDYLFLSYNDSIFYYLNRNPWELTFENVFIPDFTVTSIHGFGPYFFVRSGNIYHLYKIENGLAVSVEDSLFIFPAQWFVFFTYPFVVRAEDVYKYVEGYDFYLVAQIDIGNVNIGISGNTLIAYYFWVTPPLPGVYHSYLHRIVIEEPNFPHEIISGWGLNISQLQTYATGNLIPKKNLYYMTWAGVITTYNSQLAYLPTTEDRATISDYYIFLLGNDSLRYSRWNAGSTFYPFTWTDYTSVENNNKPVHSFELSQNYPNPFNPSTTISYELPVPSHVTIKVFDLLGREIATLIDEEKPSGIYKINFDARILASGIYYYRISAGEFSKTKKMIYLK